MDPLEGETTAEGLRIAVVASRFNEQIADDLLAGALECLERHGAVEQDVEVFRVPGAYEIPMAAKRIIGTGRFHAVVTTGVLIRGETPHFDLISSQVSHGISEVAVITGIPIAFGVITCETLEQARERSSPGRNKGWEAALAAIQMANLYRRIAPPFPS